mmetsp:Transcript_135945/g.422340  ORF Transcript_135945/g.422340 Transcript_135945/m.422340 type:complete len:246 (+) Transcript_135945:624-1361(+)
MPGTAPSGGGSGRTPRSTTCSPPSSTIPLSSPMPAAGRTAWTSPTGGFCGSSTPPAYSTSPLEEPSWALTASYMSPAMSGTRAMFRAVWDAVGSLPSVWTPARGYGTRTPTSSPTTRRRSATCTPRVGAGSVWWSALVKTPICRPRGLARRWARSSPSTPRLAGASTGASRFRSGGSPRRPVTPFSTPACRMPSRTPPSAATGPSTLASRTATSMPCAMRTGTADSPRARSPPTTSETHSRVPRA